MHITIQATLLVAFGMLASGGTTAAAQPSIAGKAVGQTVTDGTAVFTRIL